MEWLGTSLYYAAAMLWEMLWALVLGFGISSVLQVFVSKEKMVKLFGHNGLKDVLLAMSFGAASSSCSYAAAATTKTVFKKGAAFMPSMAFMIASTNLVVELGIVLYLLMGWRFVLAEFVGAFVMVGVVWLIFAVHSPGKLIEAARKHHEQEGRKGCHDHDASHETSSQVKVAHAFFMVGSMLWKEVVIGVVLAGFLMVLVPKDWWETIFISHGPHALTLIENALVGPLIALASFVCSVGNIPLASLLWSSGATFGGVIAFLYGDLIVLPLIFAYRKYYGLPAALYITGLLYVGMVVAGIVVDLVFTSLGLAPQGSRGDAAMMQAGFSWNYTTWLNMVALLGGGYLLYLHFRKPHKAEHKRAPKHAHREQHAH
jgi:uncharacterized membrane protein YraQ (UPF0718 family)